MAKKLETALTVRLAPETRRAFIRKSSAFGGTSDVLRELVLAFVEDRIKLTPPQPTGLYK